LLIITAPNIEGKRIMKYLGIVCGDAIMGANIFNDLFAGIRDIVGGRFATHERELLKAKENAIQDLTEQAKSLGGNAVVGVDIDHETIGNSGLMVSAGRTAVIYESGDRIQWISRCIL